MNTSIEQAPRQPAIRLDRAFQNVKEGQGTAYGLGENHVCSIFPVPKVDHQSHVWMNKEGLLSHRRTYSLRAITKPDDFDVLTVFDTGVQALDTSVMDHHAYMIRNITAQDVATSLIHKWTSMGGMADSEGGPGIGIIAKRIPTKEELAKLHQRQRVCATDIVEEADKLFSSDKKDRITRLHRLLGRYLGKRSSEHRWMTDFEDPLGTKRCPACNSAIDKEALHCMHCNNSLIKWAAEQFYTPDDLRADDPILAEKLGFYLQRKEAQDMRLAAASAVALRQPPEPTDQP